MAAGTHMPRLVDPRPPSLPADTTTTSPASARLFSAALSAAWGPCVGHVGPDPRDLGQLQSRYQYVHQVMEGLAQRLADAPALDVVGTGAANRAPTAHCNKWNGRHGRARAKSRAQTWHEHGLHGLAALLRLPATLTGDGIRDANARVARMVCLCR